MGYQAGLPTDNPSYPERLQDQEQERVYHLLGVDRDGHGHYWLGSYLKTSVVLCVDEDYNIVERNDWLSKTQVADYVLDHDLRDLSDLSKMHLENRSEDSNMKSTKDTKGDSK